MARTPSARSTVSRDSLNAGADTPHRWQFARAELVRFHGHCVEAVVRKVLELDREPAEANFNGRDQVVIIGSVKYLRNDVVRNGTMVRWELSDDERRRNVQKRTQLSAIARRRARNFKRSECMVIVKVGDGAKLRELREIGRSRRVTRDDTGRNKRKAAEEDERRLACYVKRSVGKAGMKNELDGWG